MTTARRAGVVSKARLFLTVLWLLAGCTDALAGERVSRKIPVTVTFDALEAKSVAVSGSFEPGWERLQPMNRDPAGRWSVVLSLPPGRYELQFLVDGIWHHDPRMPSIEDGLGGRNNLLVVPQSPDRRND